jgi:hypothetical protein
MLGVTRRAEAPNGRLAFVRDRADWHGTRFLHYTRTWRKPTMCTCMPTMRRRSQVPVSEALRREQVAARVAAAREEAAAAEHAAPSESHEPPAPLPADPVHRAA